MISKQDLKKLGVNVYGPARIEEILLAEKKCGLIPDDLKELLKVSNGIDLEWFVIYPIYSESNKKRTWDSLSRANRLATSKYISDDEFLNRFLIFAELSGPDFAVFEKENSSIWYKEKEILHKTNLDLKEFIKTVVREVNEL